MQEQQNFRWIDEDGVVLIGCLVIGAAVVLFVPAPKAEPQPAPVARPSCQITISQYGPGERWISPSSSSSGCASAAGAVPSHILSMPVAQ